jgi:hypothetical protein
MLAHLLAQAAAVEDGYPGDPHCQPGSQNILDFIRIIKD